jgi:hypothetical protein
MSGSPDGDPTAGDSGRPSYAVGVPLTATTGIV